MRKAFTMIEIVFVIVIIGLLSMIAVPKMISNRDDAKATSCIESSKRFLQDMATYYTVHGKFEKISIMSYVPVGNDDLGFMIDSNLDTSTADLYCEGNALVRFKAIYERRYTKLITSSLLTSSGVPAMKADKTLTKNNFYREYDLGGYTH